jgi:dipeptidyl aminopeptidase/acylaminoacyl peptidase
LERYEGSRRQVKEITDAEASADAESNASEQGAEQVNPAEDFFFKDQLPIAQISPDGTRIASVRYVNGIAIGVIQQPGLKNALAITPQLDPDKIPWIAWAGDDIVLAGFDGYTLVARISVVEGELERVEARMLDHPARVIDLLPNDNSHILISGDSNSVHRISVDAFLGGFVPRVSNSVHMRMLPRRPQHNQALNLEKRTPFASLEADYVEWIVDHKGAVRAAASWSWGPDPEVNLWFRETSDGAWRSIHRSPTPADKKHPFIPVGFSADNQTLYVLSNGDRDTYALFEFDVESRVLGKLIYGRPDVDIDGIVLDYAGTQILAATYWENGVLRHHYFDRNTRRYQHSLEFAFPGQTVQVNSISRDAKKIIVLVSSPRNPGAYYLLNTTTNRFKKVGDVAPHLTPERLVDMQRHEAISPDGTLVETFLTLPRDVQSPPLVVMPHGGPIGVSDRRVFDPVAQYLASEGFAVLQMNYRGSAGFGRAFLESGKKQWGGAIERDVKASLDHIVSLGLVDADRVCIAGQSYGGYSALMSAALYPERYRCAAAYAAPADIGLMFGTSDFAQTESGRKSFADIVGDPNDEYEKLLEASPIYNLEKIQIPLHISHGWLDQRVDIDHTYRLMAMLDLHGKKYESWIFDRARHSFTLEQAAIYYQELAAFLHQHLDEPVAPMPRQSP